MAQIESWKLEEIRDGLRIARNSLLELTALDSLEEMERKCRQNETAVTRKLNKCLEWLKYIEQDNDEYLVEKYGTGE